jgi:hypothetical protein
MEGFSYSLASFAVFRHSSDFTLSGILRNEIPPLPLVGSPIPSSSIICFVCLHEIYDDVRFQGVASTRSSISLQIALISTLTSSKHSLLQAAESFSIYSVETSCRPSYLRRDSPYNADSYWQICSRVMKFLNSVSA